MMYFIVVQVVFDLKDPKKGKLVAKSLLKNVNNYLYGDQTMEFMSSHHPPQKRHPALIPLSKDHHQGLLLCWKIRQGFDKNIEVDRISKYLVYFFDVHLTAHFKEEEEVLLTKLDDDDAFKQDTYYQHEEIRSLIDEIRQNLQDEKLVRQFEKKLEAHIRFEERKLFPYLQELFDEKTLLEVGHVIEEKEAADDWTDVFWARK